MKQSQFRSNLTSGILWLLVLIFFVLILFINIFQPILYDDVAYFEASQKLSLSEYSLSRYLNWTGRVQEAVITWFSYQNAWNYYFYEIISSLFLLALPLLIHLHAFQKLQRINFFLYFLILSILWFTTPSMGEIFFWNAGSSTYLFSAFFFLLFLLPYSRPNLFKPIISIIEKNNFCKLLVSLFFCLFGIWTGFAQLQVFFIGICLIGFYYFQDLQTNKLKSFSLPHHLGFLGFLIGGLILVLAPGNYNRLDLAYQSFNESETNQLLIFLQKLFKIISRLFGDFLGNFFKLEYFWLFSIPFILIGFNNPVKPGEKLELNSLIWFLAASLVNLPLAITDFASGRTLFFSIVFYLVFFLSRIDLQQNLFLTRESFTKNTILIIICLGLLLNISNEAKNTYKYLYLNFSTRHKDLRTLEDLDQKSLKRIYRLDSLYFKGLQEKHKFMFDTLIR